MSRAVSTARYHALWAAIWTVAAMITITAAESGIDGLLLYAVLISIQAIHLLFDLITRDDYQDTDE